MARRIGDPGTLAYALAAHIAANHSPTFTSTQVALATELIDVATRGIDMERAMEGHEHRAHALDRAWRGTGSDARLCRDGDDRAAASPTFATTGSWAFIGLSSRCSRAELAEAEKLIATARTLGERAQSWGAAVSHGLQLCLLRREQGRLRGGRAGRPPVRLGIPDVPNLALLARADDCGARIRVRIARRARCSCIRRLRTSCSFDEEWLVSMALLAEASKRLGDATHASILYELLLPYADRVAITFRRLRSVPVARYLGLLAATGEHWDQAERHFENALAMNERIGARSWLARTQADYADLLVARARPGDSERARDLRNSAGSTARALGMVLESAPTTDRARPRAGAGIPCSAGRPCTSSGRRRFASPGGTEGRSGSGSWRTPVRRRAARAGCPPAPRARRS